MEQIPLPQSLIELFSSVGTFEPEVKSFIESKIQIRLLAKKQFLLKPGEISKSILFVEKGMLRSYYYDNDKEITNWFMKEGQLVISVNSFFNQIPCDEFIQAIEDCKVWQMRYEHYRYLLANYHSFCSIGLMLTEHYYTLSEQRLRRMRQKDAEAKYRHLLQLYPEIMNRAPLGHIASYLGITQETLSRLRAKRF
jgi:CRP/FNR family transcriptional regulator, anaerobic regulatory protein